MPHKRNSHDDIIFQSLKEHGYIVPSNEEDIAAFKEALKKHDLPPLPDDLNDPGSILDTPPSIPIRIVPLKAEVRSEEYRNFTMAAREGKPLSSDAMQKLKRNLAKSKKKK